VLQTLSDALTLTIVECDVSSKPLTVSTNLVADGSTLVFEWDEVISATFPLKWQQSPCNYFTLMDLTEITGKSVFGWVNRKTGY